MLFITARIRRMGEVMFSVCPHLGGGGQVRVQPGGVRSESSWGGGSGQSSWGGSGQSLAGGGQVRVQPGGSGQSSQGGGGSVQPLGGSVQPEGSVSPAAGGGVSQRGSQHLAPSCGQYASCVHAGGLSYLLFFVLLG